MQPIGIILLFNLHKMTFYCLLYYGAWAIYFFGENQNENNLSKQIKWKSQIMEAAAFCIFCSLNWWSNLYLLRTELTVRQKIHFVVIDNAKICLFCRPLSHKPSLLNSTFSINYFSLILPHQTNLHPPRQYTNNFTTTTYFCAFTCFLPPHLLFIVH